MGSTNRTRIGDYEEALDSGGVTSLLKVHRLELPDLGLHRAGVRPGARRIGGPGQTSTSSTISALA